MFRNSKIRFIIYAALAIMTACGIWLYTAMEIPDSYYTTQNESVSFDTSYPVTLTVSNENDSTYDIDVKLMGVVPIKTVTVNVVKESELIPGGQAFGVKIFTEGVLVVGLDDMNVNGKSVNPSFEAGIRVKDTVLSVNGNKLSSNEDLAKYVKNSDGKTLKLEILRSDKKFTADVLPVYDDENKSYRIGLLVRDSTAGIGTVTYYDTQTNSFGALGHSISDSDTGEILTMSFGEVYRARISGIQKGSAGSPGELKGVFLENQQIGSLYKNTEVGIFGMLDENAKVSGKAVPIAFKQDVHTGKATILCTIDGTEVEAYEIEIVKLDTSPSQTTKNMLIRVTDNRLIDKTGGIVQGMSGSPIMQDGKLIGAVTHVLINSPQDGYGIFIENMLAQ